MSHPREAAITQQVFKQFPILAIDDQYYLRSFQPSDGHAFYRYMTNPKMRPFFHPSSIPSNLSQALKEIKYKQNMFQKKMTLHWGLVKRDNDELIGECGFEFWFRFHNRLELSYNLNPDYWRQGIMTKALAVMFRYAFDVMEVNRIEAFTITENHASIDLLKKLGFTHEGLLKQYRYYQGRYQDINIFSYTRDIYSAQDAVIQRILQTLPA